MDEPIGVKVISGGCPCRCGPKFCAERAGVGYYGRCSGSRPDPAPDCVKCSAPHQSTAGCWLCAGRGFSAESTVRESLLALELGVSFGDALDVQGEWIRAGKMEEFEAAIREVAARRSKS